MQRSLDHLRWLAADLKDELAFRRFRRKYSPDQPRVPAGNPDGGQWTSGGGTTKTSPEDNSTEASPPEGEIVPVASRGGIPRALWKLTVRQFVSRYCKGSISRELPSEFDDMTIADMLEIAKGGDEAANRCYKLLNQGRFRK